jgi:hypothetical protein
MTALTRQIVDNAAFINAGFWELSRDAKIDLADVLNIKPRGVLWTDGEVGKSAKRHAPEYFGDKALPLLQHFDDRTERRTGVTAYSQGLDADSLNKTARGIQAIMSQSQKKIRLIARILADGLKPLIRHFVAMNQQFLDQKIDLRLLNQSITYDPALMDFEYDLIPAVGLGTGDREQEMQDTQFNLDMLLGNFQLLYEMGLINQVGVFNAFEDYYKARGQKDATRYLVSPLATVQAGQGASNVVAAQAPDGAAAQIPLEAQS